jgi:hypothetical protein
MAKIDKPEILDNHSERLQKLDEIVEYLLGALGSNTVLYKQAELIEAKLRKLKSEFEGGDVIDINTHVLASRQRAKQEGYFVDVPLSQDKIEAENPVLQSRPVEEIAEQNKAIYELEQEVETLLKGVDGINKKSGVMVDAYFIAKGLHKPELFNSPDFQEILAKYSKKVRDKLKKLGMDAFIHGSEVSFDDIEKTLGKSA